MTKEEAINKVRQMSLPKETMDILEALAPELKESEDERIRKELIAYLKGELAPGRELIKQWLAWLEKQKEQKPAKYLEKDMVYAIMKKLHKLSYSKLIPINSDEYKKIDEITCDVRNLLDYPIEQKPEKDNNYWFGFNEGKGAVLDSPGEYGLQKPLEWDEYTKTNLDRALQIIKKAKGTLQGYQSDDGIYECDKAIECLEHFLYRGLEIEKPAEWSEEDSDNLERIDNYLWMLDDYVGDDCTMPQGKTDKIRGNIQEVLSPWLKSLPERFNLQPKQEWSEEDEKAIERAIDRVRAWEIDYCGGDNTISKRLKSLLRPSWKPSEE